MRRFLALTLAVAIVSLGVPSLSFAAGQQAQVKPVNGHVAGVARDSAGQPVTYHGVRLRDTATGQVVSTSRTSDSGTFLFDNVRAGTYVVELVDDHGAVIALSDSLTLNAGSMSVDGLVIVVGAGKGAAAAIGAAGAGAFFTSTTGILLLGAAGAGAAIGIASAARGQTKVTLCHEGQTLTVAEPAAAAHYAHGDTPGPCPVSPSR